MNLIVTSTLSIISAIFQSSSTFSFPPSQYTRTHRRRLTPRPEVDGSEPSCRRYVTLMYSHDLPSPSSLSPIPFPPTFGVSTTKSREYLLPGDCMPPPVLSPLMAARSSPCGLRQLMGVSLLTGRWSESLASPRLMPCRQRPRCPLQRRRCLEEGGAQVVTRRRKEMAEVECR